MSAPAAVGAARGHGTRRLVRMQPEPIELPTPAPISVRDGVLVLTGYGLDIRVERGQLQVRDGVGRHRREGRIHRATGRLRRLVVLGHTGAITLDAIRWLADVGAGFIQIDQDGRVLAAFGPQGTDRPMLRRAQALALHAPVGIEIAREILGLKLRHQAGTLSALAEQIEVDPGIAVAIANLAEALAYTEDVPGLRLIEARAALAYWGAWSSLPVRFARHDRNTVPDHWRTFGSRTSVLTGGPRLATNPANAILNYLYAILEGEASIAARVVGLDPGLGVIHADQLNRDSLSADLMEPVRPAVDRFVIELLARRTFAARDFFETREGVCRLIAPLAAELAQTEPRWRSLVGQVAEDVAAMLAGEGGRVPTSLSGRNRSAGRGAHAKEARIPRAMIVATCPVCGGSKSGDRVTCSGACEAELRKEAEPAFIETGRANLARLRASGWRPELSGAGRRRIARSASDLVRAAREWQRTHEWPTDFDYFPREVLPQLSELSADRLVSATGLSPAYCRRIMLGKVTPHPMWWQAIEEALGPS